MTNNSENLLGEENLEQDGNFQHRIESLKEEHQNETVKNLLNTPEGINNKRVIFIDSETLEEYKP